MLMHEGPFFWLVVRHLEPKGGAPCVNDGCGRKS